MREHEHSIQIYYEDTDHSGVVYHANYLKYFERAREHMLGVHELKRLFEEDGIGFVVYKAELTYKKGAAFADTLTIRTRVRAESEYRLIFEQRAMLEDTLAVAAEIHLVCVDRAQKLVRLPASVRAAIDA